MISGIIKVEVSVISRSLTSTLIIPDITKTESNNFFIILYLQVDVHSPLFFPLFFRVIVEIERVSPLTAAILIFRCTEGAGVGDYSSRG